MRRLVRTDMHSAAPLAKLYTVSPPSISRLHITPNQRAITCRYFNGEACLLKEGGGFVKTGYNPVAGDSYVSGPGCHAATGWGWTFIIILGVIGLLYVGGGIGFGVKIQGADASAGISAHPHLGQWKQAGGLVVDGMLFTRAHVEAKIKSEPVAPSPTATDQKNQQTPVAVAEKKQLAEGSGDGETDELLASNETTKSYGAAGTSVDPSAFAAAVADGAAAASEGSSSDEGLVE